MAFRRPLRRTGLPIREVNIWEDPDAAARVRAATGGDETVPTVFVAGQALVNPTVRSVKSAVRERAPHLLAAGPDRSRRGFRPFRR
jgi:glutaredoxin